jgi:hypothetical protein
MVLIANLYPSIVPADVVEDERGKDYAMTGLSVCCLCLKIWEFSILYHQYHSDTCLAEFWVDRCAVQFKFDSVE